jgi:membrane protein DedA with SNARE-associated domain
LNAIAQLLPDFVKQDPLIFFFAFLFLFAFTVPVCQEIAVSFVGMSARALKVGFASVASVSLVALLIQDSALFALAWMLGPRLTRRGPFARLLKPERIAAAQRYFRRRGPIIILGSRLVMGLRVWSILGSGLLRVRWSKFFLYDGIGAAIVTPAWLFVGYALGSQFDRDAGNLTKVFTIVGLAVVGVASVLVYRGVKADAANSAAADGE